MSLKGVMGKSRSTKTLNQEETYEVIYIRSFCLHQIIFHNR